jgi:hypothetical protein
VSVKASDSGAGSDDRIAALDGRETCEGAGEYPVLGLTQINRLTLSLAVLVRISRPGIGCLF